MKKLESTISLSKTTVKELIDALKVLNPDTPVQNFKLRTCSEYETHMGEPTGIINTYDFSFILQECKNLKK